MTQTKPIAQPEANANSSAGIAPLSSAQQVNQLLGSSDIQTSDRPVFGHRRVRAGQNLVRAGDEFNDLYIVNGGYFKTVFTDDTGNEQIMNFPMKGTLIGADGIGTNCHINDVVALSDADVIVIPFGDLESLTQIAPHIEQSLFRAISQQLIEEQLAVTAIGSLCAQTRLARFIVSLGEQMNAQGYARDVFVLQMSRQDIGNFLSMKIETVSRTLTAMAKKGMIGVNQREISIVDRALLESTASGRPMPSTVAEKPRDVQTKAKSVRGRKTKATTPWSGLVDMVGTPQAVAA